MASEIESSSGNPYSSDPDVSKFVKDNLSGSNNYEQWRQQMLDLINNYGLDGFITGKVKTPPKTRTVTIPEDDAAAAASHIKEIENQKASNDFLLKCIRKTLTEDISEKVKLARTAKGLWTRLEEMFRKPTMASSCIYPYPSDLVVSEFVHHTLSRRNYSEWKEQMFDLIEKEDLVGFINGTVKAPPKRITAEDTGNGDSSNLIENEDYGAWKRSDDLLRKWIRSTLAEDIRQQVRLCRTAKGLWTKLEKLFDEKTAKQLRQYQPLQMAAIYGDWKSANRFIDGKPYAVRKPINEDSETALMVAVKSKQTTHFVRNLLQKMSPGDLALGDFNGWTALHTAAVAGNIEAVELLVEKNESLPGVQDLDRQVPLFYAAKFYRKEVVRYLWPYTEGHPDDMGATLLCELVTSEFYDFALKLLKRDPNLACMEPSALLAIAIKPPSFPPLNFLERVICWVLQINQIKEKKLIHDQAHEILKFLCEEIKNSDLSSRTRIYMPPLIQAIKEGTPQIVEQMLRTNHLVVSLRTGNRYSNKQLCGVVKRCSTSDINLRTIKVDFYQWLTHQGTMLCIWLEIWHLPTYSIIELVQLYKCNENCSGLRNLVEK